MCGKLQPYPIHARAQIPNWPALKLLLVVAVALLCTGYRIVAAGQGTPVVEPSVVKVTLDAIPADGAPFLFLCENCPAPPGATLVLSDTSAAVDNQATVVLSTTGKIAIAAIVPEGWTLTDFGCVAGWDDNGEPILLDDSAFYTRANTVYVDARQAPGREAICYFHNVRTPAIELTATVGIDPAVCAAENQVAVIQGEPVTYCYTAANTGELTLTLHDLENSAVGFLRAAMPETLAPGDSTVVTYTASANVTSTHVATWTAYHAAGLFARDVASATVYVLIPEPAIRLTATVGTEPGECATSDTVTVGPGDPVTFCYHAANTGNVTLSRHSLVDNGLGPIFSELDHPLAPDTSLQVTQTANAVVSSTHFATWNAFWDNDTSATAVDNSTVNVIIPPIVLVRTVSTDPTACAPSDSVTVSQGTTVVHCYLVTNTGQETLTLHSLVDSQFGALLSNYAHELAPGGTLTATATTSVTLSTTGVATWTAQSTQGAEVVAQATATVTVLGDIPVPVDIGASADAGIEDTQQLPAPVIPSSPVTPTLPAAFPDQLFLPFVRN
jgi:hypothetical protein